MGPIGVARGPLRRHADPDGPGVRLPIREQRTLVQPARAFEHTTGHRLRQSLPSLYRDTPQRFQYQVLQLEFRGAVGVPPGVDVVPGLESGAGRLEAYG